MKNCVAILIGILVIFGIYAIYSNYVSTLNQSSSTLSYLAILSYWNASASPKIAHIQQDLCLGLTIGLIIYMQWIRYQIRKISLECDERDLSASDYTLMVQNIPKNLDINYAKELKEFFEKNNINGESFKVEKINLAYDVRELPK